MLIFYIILSISLVLNIAFFIIDFRSQRKIKTKRGFFFAKLDIKENTIKELSSSLSKMQSDRFRSLVFKNWKNQKISLEDYLTNFDKNISTKIREAINALGSIKNIKKVISYEVDKAQTKINTEKYTMKIIFRRFPTLPNFIILEIRVKQKIKFTFFKNKKNNRNLETQLDDYHPEQLKKSLVICISKNMFQENNNYNYQLFVDFKRSLKLPNKTKWFSNKNKIYIIVKKYSKIKRKSIIEITRSFLFFNMKTWNYNETIDGISIVPVEKQTKLTTIKDILDASDFSLQNSRKNNAEVFCFDEFDKDLYKKFEEYLIEKKKFINILTAQKSEEIIFKKTSITNYRTKKVESYLVYPVFKEKTFSNLLKDKCNQKLLTNYGSNQLTNNKKFIEELNLKDHTIFIEVDLSWLLLHHAVIITNKINVLIKQDIDEFDETLLKKIILNLFKKGILTGIKLFNYSTQNSILINKLKPSTIVIADNIASNLYDDGEDYTTALLIYLMSKEINANLIYENVIMGMDPDSCKYIGLEKSYSL